MDFLTDKQTLDDLNIFGKPGRDSIYTIYGKTVTSGGAALLEHLFRNPLSTAQAINDRSATIQYFSSLKMAFPFKADVLDSAEIYLAMTDVRTMLSPHDHGLGQKLVRLVSADGDYKVIFNGIIAIISIVQTLNTLIKKHTSTARTSPYWTVLQEMAGLIAQEPIRILLAGKQVDKLSRHQLADLDKCLRFGHSLTVKQLLQHIYAMDVYLSIAKVAASNNFVFPEALDKEKHTVLFTGVYHPLVKNAVANTIHITPENNIVFLTGANMAGKSTFMKSMGIALYLAHLGFPVAAAKMQFSVRDGIYTTINLPDDLSSGNSHFYAEVLRVKKVAKALGGSKNLFLIFDELFRGTNVKDACEGTIAITQALAKKRNCMFVVSTHIIEAGEVLKERCSNISFVYLPTKMEGNTPKYTYKLEPGITGDRHGMVIINRERILEIIRSRKIKTVTS